MANPKYRQAKSHSFSVLSGSGAYRFDALGFDGFGAVTSGIVVSTTNSAVQGIWPIPQNLTLSKIAVTIANGTIATSAGFPNFNIVLGFGAEASSAGTAGVVLTAGQSAFASDQSITAASTNAAQMFYPDQPEAIWPQGSVMTLRFGTNAASSAGGNVVVNFVATPQDPKIGKVTSAVPSTDW